MANCAVCYQSLSGKPKVCLNGARLIECRTCESWTYLPRPNAKLQAAIHDSAEYFDHPYFESRRNAELAINRRCRQVFTRLGAGIDLKSLQGDRLLDVGCDTGAFLTSAAQQFGVIPIGVDVAARAVQTARMQGVEAYVTDLENAPSHLSEFSVITAIDLIEHVVDPHNFLKEIFSRLRPGGLTYLETPNISSSVYQVGCLLSRITGGRPTEIFERLFPPQHIQYFTQTSFTDLAQTCGFELVQIDLRPLPFSDLATSLPIRLGLASLQLFDKLVQNEILICGLLRKPI